ncbi:STAS domain-containing protein [Candidatus Pelagisphaera phototrophica]|uniref:STAS domain-containing protein n=1 Tax=Candidatus Pelagisphaera phototrophica TaxID=2684113 RepID=UPI001A1061AF|nr:STAS domain-containing protein [Candidatus Pelagisphaera phototrophica]QXD32720.1 STAS domain-containing protein [Candidatus Pelagisphaera phototrophica]
MSTVIDGHLDNGILRVKLDVNRLDAFAARDFKKQVDLIWSKDVKQVELDFKQVGFIDSSGVGALLGVYKRLTNADGQVCLTSVQAPVQSVIELLRLHRIFKIEN